jgi:hypothetical protein
VAKKRGVEQQVVLDEWAAIRDNGTRVHEYIAQALRRGDVGSEQDDPFLALNQVPPEIEAFDKFLPVLLARPVEVHRVEWVVGDPELGIGGTVDAVLYDPTLDAYNVWDWKTGNYSLDNKFENLRPPFSELPASKHNIYSLQVGIYERILARNTDLKLGPAYLAHLDSNAITYVYKAVDFRARLLEWLEPGFDVSLSRTGEDGDK